MFTGFRLMLVLLGLGLFKPATKYASGHPLARLQSRQYRAKKIMVRKLWIATGFIMLLFPQTYFIVTLGLFTTFLAFTILDESC
jgi:hypothetical protein